MRWPRVRFTVRLLLILVAVVAVAIGAEMTRRRWVLYSEIAARHARLEDDALRNAEGCASDATRFQREAKELRAKDDPEDAQRATKLAAASSNLAAYRRWRATVYGRTKERYRLAAARPWLAVQPNPPSPEP